MLDATTKPSRVRVLKHLKKQRAKNLPAKYAAASKTELKGQGRDAEPENDLELPAKLDPGMEQLYSYYSPCLPGGLYTVDVKQHVKQPLTGEQLSLKSSQKFNVNTPRFSLPVGSIHSTYPLEGLGDYNNVLPQVVFNDSALPWEREGSPSQAERDSKKGPDYRPANKVPWLALLCFDEEELKLSDEELALQNQGGLFPERMASSADAKSPLDGRWHQNKSTFSVQMTIAEYLKMGNDLHTAICPIEKATVYETEYDTKVESIFIKGSQVNDIFASYDSDGQRRKDAIGPNVQQFQYMAHVRNVNMKDTTDTGWDDHQVFSVVFSKRTAKADVDEPRSVIVHLVTLEGIETTLGASQKIKLPLGGKQRLALISLHSWTYLSLPNDEENIVSRLRGIGLQIKENNCWLRPSNDSMKRVHDQGSKSQSSKAICDRLEERMIDGYNMQRYITQTGEETVAFYRGPLTPNYVPSIEDTFWPYQSNFSSDYQILDRDLGIMDITYSAAWQLGKSLAVANQAFSASIVRLRRVLRSTGDVWAKTTVSSVPPKSKADLLKSLSSSISELEGLSIKKPGDVKSSPVDRFYREPPEAPTFREEGKVSGRPSKLKDVRKAQFRKIIDNESCLIAGSSQGWDSSPHHHIFNTTGMSSPGYIPFNEINRANSTDWQIIQDWIMENMFLKNIPGHYIIPDPSYLPPESIRFFFVDSNWMDCFIDGALSIGNHLDRRDDVVRQTLKRRLNSYLRTKYSEDGGSTANYWPQVPCFGFFLRGSMVKAFQNLEFHAPWHWDDINGAGEREPILRCETVAEDTILVLFDRMPGSSHWDPRVNITFSQPPHQQCFQLGHTAKFTDEMVEFQFKRIYTTTETMIDESKYDKPCRTVRWFRPDSQSRVQGPENDRGELITDIELPRRIYDWESRHILFPQFGQACYAVLGADMVDMGYYGRMKFFDDTGDPKSAAIGMALTSATSKMEIKLATPRQTTTNRMPPDYTTQARQIRVPGQKTKNYVSYRADPEVGYPGGPPRGGAIHKAKPVWPGGETNGVPAYHKLDDSPRIPSKEETNITDPKQRHLAPLISSQFEFVIFKVGADRPSRGRQLAEIPVPGKDDAPIDLVVGLRRRSEHITLHNLQLFSIVAEFPMGNTSKDMFHLDDGPAPGARMLDNVRFSIHGNHVTYGDKASPERKLVITVIPRVESRLVPLRVTSDLNFALWQVRLNDVRGVCRVRIQENYRRKDKHDNAVQTNFAVGQYILKKV